MSPITLINYALYTPITEELVDKCNYDLVKKLNQLGYTIECCYQVAAIQQFFDTLLIEEREELLSVLHLKED